MIISKSHLIQRELLFEARIKELENILCPAEQHEYELKDERVDAVDGYGTIAYYRRYVCKRCLKVKNTIDCV